MSAVRRLFSTLHRKLKGMATFETLDFDNVALRTLPIDPETENYVRQVPGACFSRVKPKKVDNPQLVACSPKALALLDLDEAQINRPELKDYFSGNKILPGSETAAHCYCGHQFGYFSGQLGDGAAMYLGEVVNKAGERWEIQLKGAGPTPYSRSADGRKVLRSTIREFLCSEAIHFLGIPSTRAGTCVTSDSTVVRDMFYDGHVRNERCSIVLRIAPTFLRFGSFEIFKPVAPETGRKGPSVGKKDILISMLNYAIETFYPQIWEAYSSDKETMYIEFYKEVVRRTARMVAEWQCVGWCHGVLNTDNMSIMGITIDYGPYGFIDRYDPDFICNSSDDGGRYTYAKQPEMCKWNCQKFGEAIQDAVPTSKTEPHLKLFDEEFSKHYTGKMRQKLGLLKKSLEDDKNLVEEFFTTMKETGADFTNSFRCMSNLPLPSSPEFDTKLKEVKEYILSQCSSLSEIKAMYKPKMDPRQLQMFLHLIQTNPGIVPSLGSRFSIISQELDRMEKMEALEDKTDESKKIADTEFWDKWFDKYTARLKLEEEAMSDLDLQALTQERIKVMNQVNPRFILRNYIAQNAIAAAEKGDYSEVQRVLKLLETPYTENVDLADLSVSMATDKQQDADAAGSSAPAAKGDNSSTDSGASSHCTYDAKPPEWAQDLRVS